MCKFAFHFKNINPYTVIFLLLFWVAGNKTDYTKIMQINIKMSSVKIKQSVHTQKTKEHHGYLALELV